MQARLFVAVLTLIAFSLLYSSPGFGQTTEELKALRKELEELRKGQSATQTPLCV
ncbi:MAG: hypothetical protein HYY45_06555 [Deltaproteobacteria bacterium]|nr:hypothetical protein [Deltaproteobacteria bacterium]